MLDTFTGTEKGGCKDMEEERCERNTWYLDSTASSYLVIDIEFDHLHLLS